MVEDSNEILTNDYGANEKKNLAIAKLAATKWKNTGNTEAIG